MNEVEKMYKNAGVKYYKEICAIKNVIDKISNQECYFEVSCTSCPLNKTSFTAEKQIELIKWLSTKELKIRTNKQPYAIYIGILGNDNTCFFGCEGLYFEQTLAEVITNLWQDLTEEERKQIKEILE